MLDEQALDQAVYGFAGALQASSMAVPLPLFELYRQLGLNETEMMIILQLIAFKQGERNDMPSMDQLQARMSISREEIMSNVHKLVKMGLIKLDSQIDPQNGSEVDCYNLRPFWERLSQAWMMQTMKRQRQNDRARTERASGNATMSVPSNLPTQSFANPVANPAVHSVPMTQQPPTQATIFHFFEEEFARPLSPMECETISQWQAQDQFPDSMILAALREAVFANKVHFAYIDKVLMDWKSRQLKSLEDVKRYQQQFRNTQRNG